MLDNELYKLLFDIIRKGLAAQNIDAVVQQSNQPTQQGVPTKNTVFLTKITNKRYGWLGSKDEYDEDNSKEIHTETQNIETVFQVNALAIQKPNNIYQLTASDIINYVAAIMNSNATVQRLTENGCGIYRITDIRNPYFQDDKDRFEASPSFDFTITHKLIVTTEIPVLQSTELVIREV